MAGLPKALIRKYGISKKAWAVFRSGHSSSRSSVKTMAKKRVSRRWRGRARRRFSTAKVPFEVLIAAGTIPFTPARDGWRSDWVTSGNFQEIAAQLKMGFLGMGDGQMDIMQTLNPLNMNVARFSKTLIYAALIGMVRRKLTGKYTAPLFKKIPFIGRFVS